MARAAKGKPRKDAPASTGATGRVGGRFAPGVSGNPKGRPLGTRQKLSEDFINALSEDFSTYGAATIRKMRAETPAAYVRVVADLVPKDLNVNMDASQAFVEMLKLVSER